MNVKRLLAASAIVLSSIGAAHADQTWAWSYFGAGVTASGTLTTAGPALTFEDVIGITGVRNGAPVIGLVPLLEDDNYSYDNQFTAVGDHFTSDGLLLDFAGALPNVNLYFFSGEYVDLYLDGLESVETPVTFTVTAVPEPATMASMLAGLGLLVAYRRKVQSGT